MHFNDVLLVLRWWGSIFLISTIFLPITINLFSSFRDKGYIFAKTIGLVLLSYSIFILSFLKLFKFSHIEIFLVLTVFAIVNLFIYKREGVLRNLKQNLKLYVAEELIFLTTLFFWSYVRGNLSDIHGLEKFMDFGFVNSILRSSYFPPQDMWYSGFSINYYYFGHLVTAILIKLSGIVSSVGYNLMLATIFALCFTSILSLAINLFDLKKTSIKSILCGILSATIVTLGGNLTTIYTFFKAYEPLDKAVPFWTLPFLPFLFPNNFWYPNATRFIPFTIHEFPLYSFVVSDLHGHVLDIPFVILSIAFAFSLFLKAKISKLHLLLISLLLAIMYMTNAWDGLIYMLLFFIVLFYISFYKRNEWLLKKDQFINYIKSVSFVLIGFLIFTIPFSINFKPFVSGIGIICAPKILTDLGKIGPFLFEANHCQRSPLWQLAILYGFFYFFVICFILFLRFKRKYAVTNSDKFIAFLIIISTILIVIPEFVYVKDIYPLHYRANTMFKLVYEAFIMLSISCGYIIVKIFSQLNTRMFIIGFFVPTIILLYFVLSYPVFAINSYYNNLGSYKSLDGTLYLKYSYANDYKLINWINNNIKNQPVILEANGDSYTDYARISANTGASTIIGWPVHEWLWRGSYDLVSPRITDTQSIYTSDDMNLVKNLLSKYEVNYVVVSSLERQKYAKLNEKKFEKIGEIIYKNGQAKLYKIKL